MTLPGDDAFPRAHWTTQIVQCSFPHHWPACAATAMRGKWDQNLKPKLAIMRQCTSVTDRQTDRQPDGHWHRIYPYITSRDKNRVHI